MQYFGHLLGDPCEPQGPSAITGRLERQLKLLKGRPFPVRAPPFPLSEASVSLIGLFTCLIIKLSVEGLGSLVVRVPGVPKNMGPQLAKTICVTPAQHINFGHSHFPPKIPPKHQNGVPKMNFPELPGPRMSVEILQKSWISRISRPLPIWDFGVPILSVLRGNEVDMLGSAEICDIV